ncbi:hypothetical protein RDV89_06250 [Nocardioides zeae]|uniref:Integral membrane protein n=1 Tax=Nocardioides imazamoxiresistens TaxID=3231893 RepID=A0ABU3PTW2_9ACTN|nr:hypothetical protein [Nocardioides zeae]MDT9592658.1 hypothetical protein [Nocardioides zeae]
MDWTLTSHVVYLAVALPLTVWVARTLFDNGTTFLTEVLDQRATLAAAVNRLLVAGFYLVTIGFVLLFLRAGGRVDGVTDLVETLSVKLGVVMLVLGLVHFANVLAFNSVRRRRAPAASPAPAGPVAPTDA